MKRQDFIEMRDAAAANLHKFYCTDLWAEANLPVIRDSIAILSMVHGLACKQIEVMAVPGPTHHQMQCLVKLAASLKRIGYDFPEADERIQVVADALLEIAREGGAE